MVEQQTAGGRSTAEIVARAEAIQRRHFEIWMEQLMVNQKTAQARETTETPQQSQVRTLFERVRTIFHR